MPDREKVISLVEDAIEIVENEAFWIIASGLRDVITLLKEQDETIKELQNAYGYLQKQFFNVQDKLLKEQETKWIHREDLDFKDKLGCNHFHGMCGNCGFIHDFIDDHTGQYKYCPQCGQAVKWK